MQNDNLSPAQNTPQSATEDRGARNQCPRSVQDSLDDLRREIETWAERTARAAKRIAVLETAIATAHSALLADNDDYALEVLAEANEGRT